MVEVRMDLTKICIQENSDEQIIVLTEHDGERSFPIVIGLFEAAAVQRRVNGLPSERPLTHDLIGNMMDALGASLRKVIVTELKDSTFYANLVLERTTEAGGTETVVVDARPSDAIVLAVHHDVPIFVSEEVLAAVSIQ